MGRRERIGAEMKYKAMCIGGPSHGEVLSSARKCMRALSDMNMMGERTGNYRVGWYYYSHVAFFARNLEVWLWGDVFEGAGRRVDKEEGMNTARCVGGPYHGESLSSSHKCMSVTWDEGIVHGRWGDHRLGWYFYGDIAFFASNLDMWLWEGLCREAARLIDKAREWIRE